MPAPQHGSARTLVIMRHATAEAGDAADAERRLVDRGVADAAEAGRWLAGRGVVPDLAVVSAATRTRSTWQSVADAAEFACAVVHDEGLYAAGPETALDLIRSTDGAVQTLVVLGHNPTVGYLAQLLDDGDGDITAATEMTRGFPPAALAVLSFDGEWPDLEAASASVTAFHIGHA